MKNRTLLAAALAAALAVPAPAAAQGDLTASMDYMDLLTHTTETMRRLGDLAEDPPALRSAAEDEIAWLLSAAPHGCYAGYWGQYLLLMERSRLLGWALEQPDLVLAAFLMEGVNASVEDIGDAVDESGAACAL